MKNLLLSFLILLGAFSPLSAQEPPPLPLVNSDGYQLGSRRVRIPPPAGFVEISKQFDRVAARLNATEDPGNDMLAIHVPKTFVANLTASQDIDLVFYTKVSISKKARTADSTPAQFQAVVAEFEKSFNTYMDPDGQLMKNIERNSSKGLTEIYGKNTNVGFSEMSNLGFFEKTQNVFSGMIMANLEINDRKLTILGTLSLVNVANRLIFVYAYKMDPKGEDVAMLRDFTKNWTADIVAANK